MTKESIMKTVEELDIFNPDIQSIVDKFKQNKVEDAGRKSLIDKVVTYFVEKLQWCLSYYAEKKYYNRETLNEIRKDIDAVLARYFTPKDLLQKFVEVRPLGFVDWDEHRHQFVDLGDKFYIRLKKTLGADIDIIVEYAWKDKKHITVTRKDNRRPVHA